MLLAIVMVAGMMPVFALSASAVSTLTDSVTNSADDDGVSLSKTVTYDPDTGKVTTVVEAYTTGTVTLTHTTKPTDIILVLDVSGSMDFSFSGSDNGSGERLAAMKTAIDDFIDQTAAQNASITDPSKMHSIAIVKFADDSYYPNSTDLTPGDHMSGETNYTEVVASFTTVNASGASTLKNAVDNLKAGGATAVDYGLTLASNLLSARDADEGGAFSEREKVVIVFTDGAPTYSSSYSDQVAYSAVNAAQTIKTSGAKIYTIGIFNGADVSGTDDSNVFMNYVSSNYPNAYGSTKTEWLFVIPVTSYEIHPGAEPYHTGFYMTADTQNSLNNIFSAISSQIGRPDIELGSSATLVDVVSDYFTIEGIGSNPSITVQTAEYLGNDTWGNPKTDTAVVTTITNTDTIAISGFDFDENYVSERDRDGFYGKKLIVTFVTLPNYEKIDQQNAFTGAKIPTNDTTAILDSEGNTVDYVSSPALTANTVTYQVIDSATKTIATYYRLPGSTVTLLNKPSDTAEYTYGEWTTSDLTLSGTSFRMPQKNVTLSSTGTQRNYTVYYTYTGSVPTGVSPATAPASATYTVGASVTLPTVTVPTGYAFSGWIEDGYDITTGTTSFQMPSEDLHFEGHFIALTTSYTVEHYLMNEEGDYESTADHKNVYDAVKIGDPVKVTIPAHTGYTYDVATTTSNNTTMDTTGAQAVPAGNVLSNGGLVLKVYYKRNQHKVTYIYDGTVPDGATPAESALSSLTQNVYYGAEVTIADPATANGYTFSGWRVYTGDTSISADGKTMIMPNSDVVLHGSFTANGDTPYTIEHYFENLNDDNYTIDTTKTSNKTGKTDTTAYAEPLSGSAITGFTYDAAKTAADGKVSGNINGDSNNPLVLKLYYTRTRHEVIYEYTGDVPGTADPSSDELLAAPYRVTVKYGTEVTIADSATADGYTFSGWRITGTGITISGNTFVMPTRDVVLTGHFSPIPSKYTVQHWLERDDGTYTYLESSNEFSVNVHVNDDVTGIPKEYNTYTYDSTKTAAQNTSMTTVSGVSVPTGKVTSDGNLVLKLLYTRKAYDITYRLEGNVPEGVETPDGAALHGKVKRDTVVDLASITVPDGYTFDGWYHDTTLVQKGRLTMPTTNVELIGYFTAKTNVPYTVKYYLQNTDGLTYTEDTKNSYTATGTTGEYVVGLAKEYPGFSFDMTQGVWNGHIKGDGSLVLELYYNRNSYTVSYYYFGTPPTDTTISMDGQPLTLSAPEYLIHKETVRYGTTATVKSDLVSSNSNDEFRGWYTANLSAFASNIEIAPGTTYTMPAHNVEFRGALYDYTVYYNLDGGTLNGLETVDPKHVNWNDADLLPSGTPQKSRMIFSGWSYEGKTAYVSSSDKYSDLATIPYVDAIVLKAEYANGYTVTYDWGTENIPADVTLPTDSNLYAKDDSYTIDTNYPANYTVKITDQLNNVTGVYTFSGWTDPNNGVMGESTVTVTGSWSYTPVTVPTWKVEYSWTNAPDGVYAQAIPNSVYTLVNGSTYTVDSTYTSSTVIEKTDVHGHVIGRWTFSGWDKSGSITVTGDVIIRGSWTYETVAVPGGNVTLIKVDAADHTTVLSGVVFALYREDGTYIGTYTTDEKGEIRVSDLSIGNYYWQEIRSAAGYVIDNSQKAFTVYSLQTTYVVMENRKTEVPVVFGDDHYAYIIGYEDGLVHPEANITRAEVATIFFRLLSEQTRSQYMTRENSFSDVNEGDWYNTAISTMAAMGIVSGRPGNVFDPNAYITRAEFSAIAARFDAHGNTTETSFVDIYEHWAKKEINIAANNGWVLGYEDGTFKPDQNISRAEAMTMVNRVLQRIPQSKDDLLADMVIWPDNADTEKWYYRMVQEATNSHYYARKQNGYEYWIALREAPDWAAYEKQNPMED